LKAAGAEFASKELSSKAIDLRRITGRKVQEMADIILQKLSRNSQANAPLRRALVSLFLVWHLTALAVSAIPDPNELRLVTGVRQSTDDASSALVRPVLDAAALGLGGVAQGAWRLTGVVRPATNGYAGRLGLTQYWAMFGNPPTGAEYLRFRYYSARDRPGVRSPLTVSTELVFPVAPETENDTARAYWQGHRDKAISNALVAYFRERTSRIKAGRAPTPPDPALEARLARTFLPVVHFFSDQYARTRMPAGDRLVRTEAWYGFASSRLRGDVPIFPQSHRAAIERYYRGVPEESVPQAVFLPIDATETEADIVWLLIHIRA
jgi:hypothetical protein